MKKLLLLAAAVAFVSAGSVQASEDTWKGTISDAMCATKEKMKADRTCVEKCVQGGQAYVFVAGDKVYKIANQDFAGLKAHAAHEVNLTGSLKDDTITVSKIEMPQADKKTEAAK